MASKFQNRLVGIIVIITTVSGTIISVLLDGNKRYNKTEFTTISLVPSKISNKHETKLITPINHKRLMTSLESTTEAMISKTTFNSKANSVDGLFAQQQEQFDTAIKVKKPALVLKHIMKPNKKTQALQAPPVYIIQLAVLKNAAKVEEIVAKLRLANYQAYTEPSLPTNGQLTRIFIGPIKISKDKLQSSLSELKDLTGLQGKYIIINNK